MTNESDVEHKLIWPMLTEPMPNGFGFGSADVATKASLRRLEIGKGADHKLYYPDYVVILCGMPVLVIEAKKPGANIEEGLRECRLYAAEINALFPTGINPCRRVICCNGTTIASGAADSTNPDIRLEFAQITIASEAYAKLTKQCARVTLNEYARSSATRLTSRVAFRALNNVGGQSTQDEELPSNTFGATIAADFGHLFNPTTRADRANVVRNAYVPSLRRERFIEPIDRVIRNSVAPSVAKIPLLEDTGKPAEIERALRERRELENQILILVGSVGAGKSTFVDYLSEVALPEDLLRKSIWVRLNLNAAPLMKDLAYDWVAEQITSQLRATAPQVDFDELSMLERVFWTEVSALKKGPLALLGADSPDFKRILAERLIALQSDRLTVARATARYLCAGPGKLLIVALDNCDKRNRDEQLTMFQVAQWVQIQFRSLVIIPLRDVTYELHKHEPPLDTAVKGLVFRIEPPPFGEVLQRRVLLALREMEKETRAANTLTYQLPNGIKVTYPASDQGLYLASILKSLWAHDRFVRQIVGGIAGRDVRRSLEIFLDFCTSGHIGEDEIYKIRQLEGKHILPFPVVARVLLRMHRRYYDGNRSYLKNLVQTDPDDPVPDHFVRVAILKWLSDRLKVKGPSSVPGFHRAGDLSAALIRIGHAAERVQSDLLYLIRERCVVVEHLRTDNVAAGDLVAIGPSGVVHLQLMASADYLAACAEDVWVSDAALALRVAERVGRNGPKGHFARRTVSSNAGDLVTYLRERALERPARPEGYLSEALLPELEVLKEAEASVAALEVAVSRRVFVANLPFDVSEAEVAAAFAAVGIPTARVHLLADRNKGRGRGVGFVTVVDHRSALRALDFTDRIKIKGRMLRIEEADETDDHVRRRAGGAISERVNVANLPADTTIAEVTGFFAAHGLVAKDVHLTRPKGPGDTVSAFVTGESVEAALDAIGALNDTTIRGHRIRVRPASPRPQKR